MALRQKRLKLLVAYSTVAQIGYLFLVFPLASSGTAASVWAGAIFFMLAHACGKAAMFLVAGAIHHTAGHDRIDHLAGAGGPLGVLVVVFALASVTIIGLPPSGGFFAKWMLLDAAIVSGQWGYVLVMALGSLLAAAYVVRVLAWAFLDVERTHYTPLPWVMKWPPLALSVISLLLGLGAYVPVMLSLLQAPVAGAVLTGAGP
jgi:formate hydrogenlyase subunit 3/multisubunit Na+/H+ antiporter MnhD subunit